MVTHFDSGYDAALESVKQAVESFKPVTSLIFKGSCDSLDDPGLYSAGDIVLNTSDGLIYVCVGAGSWEPLSYVDELYECESPKIQRKVISHCPHCGGAVTHITPEGESEGYQQCEWCMSVINVFED